MTRGHAGFAAAFFEIEIFRRYFVADFITRLPRFEAPARTMPDDTLIHFTGTMKL
jgi:hypothetical protein